MINVLKGPEILHRKGGFYRAGRFRAYNYQGIGNIICRISSDPTVIQHTQRVPAVPDRFLCLSGVCALDDYVNYTGMTDGPFCGEDHCCFAE